MTFDSTSNGDERDSGQSAGRERLSEPTVNVSWENEPIPVSEAVAGQQELINDLYDRNVATDRVDALEQRVSEMADTVNDVEESLAILAVTSDVATKSDCPNCNGQLERTRKNVACDTCGHVAARLE